MKADQLADPVRLSIDQARTTAYFFRGQLRHLLALVLLLLLLYAFAAPSLGDDSWLGRADSFWMSISVALVIIQQVLGWLVFRGQLGWAIFTRWFGAADMFVWGLIFIPLLIARPVLILILGIADKGSILLPNWITLPLALILLVPSVFTLFSVQRYFSLERALGGDHFRLKYRQMPLVREGAFKWSENAMYLFVLFGCWSIALLTRSQAALALAVFQHAYVWVHYFFTEQPDMELLYPDENT